MSLARALVSSLLLILLSANTIAAESPGFRYGGEVYAGKKLPTALQQKLFELEVQLNQQRRQAVDEYAIERYMTERAEREKRPLSEIQNELFAIPDPDDETLKSFYDANQARIPGSFEEMKGQIADYLRSQLRQRRVSAVLDLLKKEKGYEVYLTEPEAPIVEVATKGYPFKGNADAKVTIVEFADYQCPHCKDAAGVMNNLVKRYGDKIRVVFRDFPVNRSGISRKVAEGAVCAEEQGRFWDFHDLAFERQSYLKAITPAQLAEELGLDLPRFEACLGKETTRTRVSASLEEGRALGISATPTFYINGRQLHAHGDLEPVLTEAIERALR
ncbi:MAG: DsbA family protein [Pseudomonadota bacterium]|nr:MAG: DsbA family protein [Pseudomonadota bacterium]